MSGVHEGETDAPSEVRGSGCTVVRAADGQSVEKRFDRRWWWFLDHRHDKFDRERRTGMLLRRHPPPVQAARLLGADRRSLTLRFEAVDGDPYGPKYPLELTEADVDALVGLADAMASYRPPARFARRFDLTRRVRRAVRADLLAPTAGQTLLDQAAGDPPTLVFGHGDITARNVLRSPSNEPVLIDWEWAGRYPRGWDLAFLWFSLVDTPGGRGRVEAAVPAEDETWFWRSALLIQLLHLHLPSTAGSPFRRRHEQTRDALVGHVCG